MARKTKEEKRIESEVYAAQKKYLVGVQVNIMDLGKIAKAGEDAARNGGNIDEAVKAAVAQYAV